jgi:hypothetical protein
MVAGGFNPRKRCNKHSRRRGATHEEPAGSIVVPAPAEKNPYQSRRQIPCQKLPRTFLAGKDVDGLIHQTTKTE